MSRGKSRIERKDKLDPVYHSAMITKFIKMIMRDGKKEVAEKVVYRALVDIEKKIIEKCGSVTDGFMLIIDSVAPKIHTRVKRIGGANYQVPVEIPNYKRISMGMKILKKAANKKKGICMSRALAQEMLDALEQKGEAYKEKVTIEKMALANKAYAHLA